MSEHHPICDICGAPVGYVFRVGGAPAKRCLRHAIVYRPVRRQALRVAAVVGTVLFFINQADVVLSNHLTPFVALKIALTYLVPFSVSTFSALQINRLHAASRYGGFHAD